MANLPDVEEDAVGETPVLVLNDPLVGYDDSEVPPETWLEVDPLGS